MQIVLTQNTVLEPKESFYTDDELHLLYQLENGLEPSSSHDEVMMKLRKELKLDEI